MMFKNVKHKEKRLWQAVSMDLLKVLKKYDLWKLNIIYVYINKRF